MFTLYFIDRLHRNVRDKKIKDKINFLMFCL